MTPSQRARKVAAARKHMTTAALLLGEVCDDYNARSWQLTLAERNDWRATLDMLTGSLINQVQQ